jgi:hypothetical protein
MNAATELEIRSSTPPVSPARLSVRYAYLLSLLIVPLMVAASMGGLFVQSDRLELLLEGGLR